MGHSNIIHWSTQIRFVGLNWFKRPDLFMYLIEGIRWVHEKIDFWTGLKLKEGFYLRSHLRQRDKIVVVRKMVAGSWICIHNPQNLIKENIFSVVCLFARYGTSVFHKIVPTMSIVLISLIPDHDFLFIVLSFSVRQQDFFSFNWEEKENTRKIQSYSLRGTKCFFKKVSLQLFLKSVNWNGFPNKSWHSIP